MLTNIPVGSSAMEVRETMIKQRRLKGESELEEEMVDQLDQLGVRFPIIVYKLLDHIEED